MKRHAYRFTSRWKIAQPRGAVVDVLLRHEAWAKWWPGMESVIRLNDSSGEGARFLTRWRSPAGYRFGITLTITHYDPERRIAFASDGDLDGEGSFDFASPTSMATEVVIRWNVQTTKRWMNTTALFLRPFFVYNHARLMQAGERGLRNYMKQQKR